MKNTSTPIIFISAILLSACAASERTAYAPDDVYGDGYARAVEPRATEPATASSTPSNDYYDPAEAKLYEAQRDYYDMAYNDPYYYNYGRFGFQTGMGWGAGMGMGMGMGYGYGSGWNDPYWNNSYMSGYGAWGYPGYGAGYGYGGYGGFGGYGSYYGPWGNCYSCYQTFLVLDGGYSPPVVQHRSSFSGGSGTTPIQSRGMYGSGDAVGLMPSRRNAWYDPDVARGTRTSDRIHTSPADRTGRTTTPSTGRSGRSGTFESGRSTGTSPTRSTGGGSRSTTGGRR